MFISSESIKKAASLARKNNILVNSDLKKQEIHLDRAVVIKEIPMNTPKEMIIAAVSEFGQIKLIKIQLIGLWQKAVVEFAELEQAVSLAAKWSFLIGKNSVHVAIAVKDRDTWASRDQFRALLFTLPVGTTAHDLGDLLDGAGRKTCIINHSLKTGNRFCCAVVGFETDEMLESAFCTELILGSVKLSWARLDLVQYGQCEKFSYSVLECNAEITSTFKSSKSFKRVVSDENHLQLARLYVKKGVPISRLVAFGGKLWAQVVLFTPLSNNPHFGFNPGFGSFSSNASGVIGPSPHMVPVSTSLEACFASLEHSVELLVDKMSGIVSKLENLVLMLLALASSSQNLVVPVVANVEVDSDMALDNPKPVLLPSFLVSFNTSELGSSSSKILTSKMGCLESKLMALEALVCSVLVKLDQMCIGSGVRVFVFGLNLGYLGSGVVIIINVALAKHMYRISEVFGHFFAIKLLFKNKLSVSVLGLYADAFVSMHFSQADKINALIAGAVNESSFIILGGNFNKDGSRKSASFKKCGALGLVNPFINNVFLKTPTWSNLRGVVKTIDYLFVSLNLVNAIMDRNILGVVNFFDTDHQAVSVSLGLGGLLNTHLCFIRKQTNKDH
ncbi:hypothetical protein G9A89_018186 [Geosiphon pyriformis]|nr:hypothetical protein G9A89_018186 [Geosiphon pyriformis]